MVLLLERVSARRPKPKRFMTYVLRKQWRRPLFYSFSDPLMRAQWLQWFVMGRARQAEMDRVWVMASQ